MLNEDLYRRGYSARLLNCITKEQAEYVLTEIHEGVCGNHSGARTMAAKVLRPATIGRPSKEIAPNM